MKPENINVFVLVHLRKREGTTTTFIQILDTATKIELVDNIG